MFSCSSKLPPANALDLPLDTVVTFKVHMWIGLCGLGAAGLLLSPLWLALSLSRSVRICFSRFVSLCLGVCLSLSLAVSVSLSVSDCISTSFSQSRSLSQCLCASFSVSFHLPRLSFYTARNILITLHASLHVTYRSTLCCSCRTTAYTRARRAIFWRSFAQPQTQRLQPRRYRICTAGCLLWHISCPCHCPTSHDTRRLLTHTSKSPWGFIYLGAGYAIGKDVQHAVRGMPEPIPAHIRRTQQRRLHQPTASISFALPLPHIPRDATAGMQQPIHCALHAHTGGVFASIAAFRPGFLVCVLH